MPLEHPWAKTSPSGAVCSLIDHCHHVAVMARRLMASSVLQRRLATAFEVDLTEQQLDRLAILAGLHDFGKALKGFQDKLEGTPLTSRGHVPRLLPFSRATLAFNPLFNCHCSPIGSSRCHMRFTQRSAIMANQSVMIEFGLTCR